MNALAAARMKTIEATLSTAAGVDVEVTIRGERSFTWSFIGKNDQASAILAKIATDGGDEATAEAVNLCDPDEPAQWYTCVYVEARA